MNASQSSHGVDFGLVERVYGRTKQIINQIIARIEEIGPELEALGVDVQQWLHSLGESLSRFFDFMESRVDAPGAIFSGRTLGTIAQQWGQELADPVSKLSATLQPAQLHTSDSWKGIAAQAYGNILTPQKNAIDAITMLAEGIATAQRYIELALEVFWIAVIFDLIRALVKLIAGLAALSTPITWAAALPLIGAAVGELLGVVVAGGGAAYFWIGAQGSSLDNLNNNNAGFSNGHWPQATISGN